ncbi:hypothetical protein ThvES_00000340 [Thiovulum sp. ES]|nr:hypothetical protein ThvES_00000340 [Thiovulum sp. ES]
MLKLLIPLFFFISCSEKNINSIDSYKVLNQKEEKIFPTKYLVSVNGDENLENSLQSLSTVEISENSEFLVSVSKKVENLGKKKLYFGVIRIENSKHNFEEKSFPFSGEKSEFEKIFKKVADFFSRKRAFISEKREDSYGETIFKINIGKRSGISENMRADIFTYKIDDSFFNKERETKRTKVATATVSNIIEEDSSWVILENNKFSNRVSEGDEVFFGKGKFSEYLLDGKLFIKTNSNLIENKLK